MEAGGGSGGKAGCTGGVYKNHASRSLYLLLSVQKSWWSLRLCLAREALLCGSFSFSLVGDLELGTVRATCEVGLCLSWPWLLMELKVERVADTGAVFDHRLEFLLLRH